MLDVVLEESRGIQYWHVSSVSILVVLDVVLEEYFGARPFLEDHSFNPCCAGCSSGSSPRMSPNLVLCCFNPCCAGCSSGRIERGSVVDWIVGFNPCCAGCSSGRMAVYPNCYIVIRVSILVVLDVVLEALSCLLITPKGKFQSLLCWM